MRFCRFPHFLNLPNTPSTSRGDPNAGNASIHIILTQDFFPMIGGAHLWLYEVYKRWPSPAILITRHFPPVTELHHEQSAFDQAGHGALTIKRHDIAIEDIDLKNPAVIKRFLHIVSLVRKHDCQHGVSLHCIRAFPEGFAAALYKLSRFGNCRIITYAHGEELLTATTSRQLKAIARIAYRLSDIVITNSQSTRHLAADMCPHARTEIIHPGVDSEKFIISDEQRAAIRANWNWPDETVVLITIARMEPRKNHSGVLTAMASLREEGLPLAYVIGSDGEERDKLAAQTRMLGIEEWVRFTGTLSEEEKAAAFAAADIHVMPSIQVGPMIEGFGIVFLEAAAAGIPSISGNIGGQPEAVVHGETGIVVDGANVEQIKSAVRLLAQDRELRHRMGKAGRRWARQNDWNRVVEKTFRVVCGATRGQDPGTRVL